VGGGLWLSNNQLEELPKSIENIKVGGCLYLFNNQLKELPRIKQLSGNIVESKWCYIDGIVRKIITKKTVNDLTVIKTHFDYIVGKDGIWSHGKTLKEAKEDLEFKFLKRNTEELKNFDLDAEISLKEAVNIYRAITGACKLGCENFIKQNKVPDKLTLREGIKLLNNEYGSDKFKEFYGLN